MAAVLRRRVLEHSSNGRCKKQLLDVNSRPTTACTRLGYAAPSLSFVQIQLVFPAQESLVHRRAGEANRYRERAQPPHSPRWGEAPGRRSPPRRAPRPAVSPLGAGLPAKWILPHKAPGPTVSPLTRGSWKEEPAALAFRVTAHCNRRAGRGYPEAAE